MKVVGIDLGTTRSLIAHIDATGRPTVIPSAEGDRLTPSVILFKKDKDKINAIVGKRAKSAMVARAEDVAMLIKRHMSEEDWVFIDAEGKEWRPETLSALILKKLKQDAEKYLGEEVTHAVITVPYYFANLERERTKQAGEIAGLDVLGILDEPIAAVYAYALDRGLEPMTCCVYDFGGGTFDVSIIEVTPEKRIVVKATSGDRFLGGADVDAEIVRFFAGKFKEAHEIDPLSNLRTHQEFLDRAERAKEDLSSDMEVYVPLTAEGKTLDLTFERTTFEEIISPHIDRTIDSLHDALIGYRAKRLAEELVNKENLSEEEIDKRIEEEMIRIREELENIRQKASEENATEEDKAEWQRIRSEEWEKIDRILLVGGSTRIPLVKERIKTETGKEPEIGFNPDEIVAIGAAIQAAWRAKELTKEHPELPTPEVRDSKGKLVLAAGTTVVVSHSLGIKAKDPTTGQFINSKIILKDTEIPEEGIERTEIYETEVDNQTSVQIILLQGEADDPEYCRIAGSKEGYLLTGIKPRLKGETKIKVIMKIDRENIVHLTAMDVTDVKKKEDEKKAPRLDIKAKVEWLDEEGMEEQKEIVGTITIT